MAMNSTSSSANPTTTTPTPTTTRLLTNPPQQQSSRPLTPLPQPHPYPYPSQPQPLFTAQSHPPTTTTTTRLPNPNPNSTPHFPKPHDTHPTQGILYPVASSGRGFIPKPLRPQPSDQTVTVANPGAFPPRSIVAFPPHHPPPFGFSSSDCLNHPMHLMRPPYLHHSHISVAATAASAPIKGIPVSARPKVASSPSAISDSNGYKDLRDRSRDDTFVIVRDRKVRISDGASLYGLCQSWLRNGFHEESQPQYGDGEKSLPRPLPMPVVDTHLPKKKEGEEEEDDKEGSVGHLSAQDLLQRHIKRAKRVRARLREVRLQRIARYKTRLATLLPPPVEQFRDDTVAGN